MATIVSTYQAATEEQRRRTTPSNTPNIYARINRPVWEGTRYAVVDTVDIQLDPQEWLLLRDDPPCHPDGCKACEQCGTDNIGQTCLWRPSTTLHRMAVTIHDEEAKP